MPWPAADLLREELPYLAGFLAGKAYARYRSQGGAKRSPIADLYIGAHAAVCGYRLLTRDGTRYRTYFPKLDLITPTS
ncbi:type II toxin-antitoxin system VapC family toxin [Micromonospora echinofusca]|uniref:type II toxin-antitoxin system VapC family toxin n=1 Tax=Micromonospora echinofusca TaxID=47858 RepID=UPI00201FCBBE|nr:type II toxin-antitoxin system VapC family toxin [Micromonospora sp. MSM11]MCL7456928.1 type II toxin-antitoxin system VapC family toxin [Micromonospora sp. MSM11]